MQTLELLFVPGLGEGFPSETPAERWRSAAATAARRAGAQRELRVHVHEVAGALVDPDSTPEPDSLDALFASCERPLPDESPATEAVAVALLRWVADEPLRERLCAQFLERVHGDEPEVIVAHGVGSLVAYQALLADPEAGRGRALVTLASPIGNPYVCREAFGGRVTMPGGCRLWRHLHNPSDRSFVAPLQVHDPRFRQVETAFRGRLESEHAALPHLLHPGALRGAWPDVLRAPTTGPAAPRFATPRRRAPRRRALLVGIDAYPHPPMRLRGCVNDVYLVSSMLQEVGYCAEDIRIVLDGRATTRAILERLQWLVDGVRGGEERFFYFSGHGAQLPGYGLGERVDRLDEALVAHDFDWSAERAVTDDALSRIYSQLPYDTLWIGVLDCCHSGGMARDGQALVRGLDPPLDVKHRALRWDPEHELWVPRGSRDEGQAGTVLRPRRLGRSGDLRSASSERFDRLREHNGHAGPYMPTLVYSCEEHQRAREYDHGSSVHGAFTFCFVRHVRRALRAGRSPSVMELCENVAEDLHHIGFDQNPAAEGPGFRLRDPLPWTHAARPVRPDQGSPWRARDDLESREDGGLRGGPSGRS